MKEANKKYETEPNETKLNDTDDLTRLKSNEFLVVTLNNERHFIKMNLIPPQNLSILQNNKTFVEKEAIKRTNLGKILLRDLAKANLEEGDYDVDLYKKKMNKNVSFLKLKEDIYEIKPSNTPNYNNFDVKLNNIDLQEDNKDFANGEMRTKLLNTAKMKLLKKSKEIIKKSNKRRIR